MQCPINLPAQFVTFGVFGLEENISVEVVKCLLITFQLVTSNAALKASLCDVRIVDVKLGINGESLLKISDCRATMPQPVMSLRVSEIKLGVVDVVTFSDNFVVIGNRLLVIPKLEVEMPALRVVIRVRLLLDFFL